MLWDRSTLLGNTKRNSGDGKWSQHQQEMPIAAAHHTYATVACLFGFFVIAALPKGNAACLGNASHASKYEQKHLARAAVNT